MRDGQGPPLSTGSMQPGLGGAHCSQGNGGGGSAPVAAFQRVPATHTTSPPNSTRSAGGCMAFTARTARHSRCCVLVMAALSRGPVSVCRGYSGPATCVSESRAWMQGESAGQARVQLVGPDRCCARPVENRFHLQSEDERRTSGRRHAHQTYDAATSLPCSKAAAQHACQYGQGRCR